MTATTEARVGDLGERALIARLRSRIPRGSGVLLGIGDDAALVATGAQTLVTSDSLVEGVHFVRHTTTPRLLGRKALSVNLSDIGAMGGVARYAIVSLCLPPDLEVAFVDGLYDGLVGRAAETGVDIVGGNLSSASGGLVIDVSLLGDGGALLRRSGARPGDLAVVTGRLGAAAAGLEYLRAGFRLADSGRLVGGENLSAAERAEICASLGAHLDPAPPLTFARSVAEAGVAAGMDLSDGLSGDLLSLCLESGVGARVELERLPIDEGARRLGEREGLEMALHGGEDYQLLLGVAPERLETVGRLAAEAHVSVTVLGAFESGEPRVLLGRGGRTERLEPRSHEHFRSRYAGVRP